MIPTRAHRRVSRASTIVVLAAGLVLAFAGPAAALEIQEVRSGGGIVAWLVEAHGIPIVALQAAFRGGAALDPDGKEGLANMAADLLDEGAGDLDSQAFHGRLEDLSIGFSVSAGRDDLSLGLRTVKANQDEAFRLLALALTKPRFDAEAVERVRSQIITGIERDADNPHAIAAREFRSVLYARHPYAYPVEGTLDSIKAIAPDDLRRFVDARLARSNLVLAVVGDITATELAGLIDRTFGGLPATPAPATVPDVVPATSGKIVTVEKDIPQSTVLFGQRGIKRDDPRWYGAEVVNYILGGGSFTSRLYQEVREKRGLAYSVYTALAPYDHAALIEGAVGTENGRVGESIARIRAEFRRMHDDGPTEAELEAAKTYLTGSFPLRFDNTSHTASILVAMQLEKLGRDYIGKHNALIEAVSLDAARKIAHDLLDPDHLTFVVVGKPDDILKGSDEPPSKGDPI